MDQGATARAERDRDMVELHRGGMALRQIGDRFGVSAERVRQIVRGAEGRRPRPKKKAAEGERVRLRIGNLANSIFVKPPGHLGLPRRVLPRRRPGSVIGQIT